MDSLAVISVESTTAELVSKEISTFHHPVNPSFFSLGLNILIEDRAEIFAATEALLTSQGIEDPFRMPLGFPRNKFSTEIDIFVIRESVAFSYIDCIADSIAIYLSKKLKTRAILRIDDYETPLFAYDSGDVVYEAKKEYASFYRNRRWQPQWGRIFGPASSPSVVFR